MYLYCRQKESCGACCRLNLATIVPHICGSRPSRVVATYPHCRVPSYTFGESPCVVLANVNFPQFDVNPESLVRVEDATVPFRGLSTTLTTHSPRTQPLASLLKGICTARWPATILHCGALTYPPIPFAGTTPIMPHLFQSLRPRPSAAGGASSPHHQRQHQHQLSSSSGPPLQTRPAAGHASSST